MSNTEIWDALCKSDPKQTKSFSRAGGFKGTALKPIWIVKRLTEQFGPCGLGWGIGKPEFQVVPSGDEMLVYCTVSAWHGSPEKLLWGVGGDKVTTKRQSGAFNDDEAFKKAFTDAVGNAFKFIGVGADIHMGQFDDSKYVQAMEREFSEPEKPKRWEGRYPTKTALKQAMHTHHAELERLGVEGTLDDLEGYLTSPEYQDYLTTAEEHAAIYLHGGEGAPPEFIPTYKLETKVRDIIALRGNVPA
jgi:hypothetical protein